MLNKIKNILDIRRHSADKIKEFIFNLFLGLAIIIFFIFVKDTTIRQELINSWFDKYIFFRCDDDTETKRIGNEMVFLDFDNTSMEELKRPDLTPRDKVSDLVKIAYEKDAKLIIIDMIFSEPDYSPTKLMAGDEIALNGESRDKNLYDLLEKIKNDNSKDTKVLIPFINYSDQYEKPNIFSNLIDNKKIYSVTSTFTANNLSDWSVRFWLPYIETKQFGTEEKHLLWSIPIMTMALTIGNEDELKPLEQLILNDNGIDNESYKLNIMRQGEKRTFTFYEEQYKKQGLIRNTQSHQYNRIQYTILPPDVKITEPFGNIPAKHIGHWRNNEFKLDNERIDCKDKIVIIGRADANCGDLHATPIDIMPGMYIHGNIIATVLSETQPHLTSISKHLIIEILLVIIASYMFLLIPQKTKYLIPIMIGMCWAFSYLYFCYSNEFVFFSFAFTFIGVYNWLKNIQNFFRRLNALDTIRRFNFFRFRR